MPMDFHIAELTLAEYQTRLGGSKRGGVDLEALILAECFEKQKEFVLDESRAAAVCCERRAGKTVGITAKLLKVANSRAGYHGLYLNPTAKQATDIMWDGEDGIKNACARLGIKAHLNNQRTIATMPNGSKIHLGGAEKAEDITQYRGRKFKIIFIDEAGSFRPHLESLVVDVLQPTLMDMSGTLCMSGTPPKILAGLFYDAIREDEERNPAYKLFKWSIFDNPHINDPAGFHEWILATNSWTREHPTFQREYLGRCVREDQTLVYKNYEPGRNGYETLPPGHVFMHVLGVDLGWEDETALRIVSFTPTLPHVYFGRCYHESHMSITSVAKMINDWDNEFGFVTKVADFGGGGKQIVQEMNDRFNLNLEPAQKKAKASFIETLNDDLLGGKIKIRADDDVIGEWEKLQWNEVEALRGGERVMVKIEDPRLPNHLSDATLYAWREAKHFMYEAPPPPLPKPGEEGFAELEAQMMAEEALKRYGGQEKPDWWSDGYSPGNASAEGYEQ